MTRALELAAQGDHRTSPNPMVGAVLVGADGTPVGEGYTSAGGRPHAETNALLQAAGRARGGTAYVTLEPCSHQGQTPPCADALIAAGVSRVVVAMLDPDLKVDGAGVERLLEAGVQVQVGVGERPAARLNEFFIVHRRTGRPFVSVKFAASLDGKIATPGGESRWITGEVARAHAHRLRHAHDAILVGAGTLVADDPELSARFLGARQPVRVILDSRLRSPVTARAVGPGTLIASAPDAPAVERAALEAAGAEVLIVAADARGRPELAPLLAELGRRQLISLLVEGGAQVHGAFFDAGLVDRVYAYLAPRVIGGAAAPGPVAGAGVAGLAGAHSVEDLELERLGQDLLVTGRVRPGTP